MTVFDNKKLRVASFKGVDFHYQSSSIDGGRKTITHEYPDSDIRYVEDLGKLEKVFNISAIIDNNSSYSDRDTFLNTLEEEGIGILVHPEYGTHNVSLKGYTVSNDISKLGVSSFDLVFEVAQVNRFPATTKGNKGFLANLKTSLLGSNESKFDSLWSSVSNKKQEFDSAVRTTQDASREIQRISAVVDGTVDGISDYVTTLNELVDDATVLVQTPSNLSAKLRATFDNLEVAYDKSQDVFDIAKGMFGFDQRDRNATGNSGQQLAIKNNQDQINNFINASALALAYNAAANISYTNFDETNAINEALEDGFNSLPSTLDRDIYKLLLKMRVETSTILNNIGIALPKVTTLKTNKTSLNVLTYSLYGSLDKKNDIKNLNQFIDTSVIEGEIKILSNV